MKIYYHSPIGIIEIEGGPAGVRSCSFASEKEAAGLKPAGSGSELEAVPDVLEEARRQLDEYFKGRRQKFSVRLDLRGTEFQRKVWAELRKIPFGQTRSYGEIARACGRGGAARAVGGANHMNPVVILVPCHRVIGADGSLTGFGGGLWRKKWLLEHEKKVLEADRQNKYKK
ncbi:MAG: Methylated-DNA--protein-cysteine methyltransferase [Candidatus Saccharicenans subterraneus]|uniref:Methylated-DNA--protein-cysteine methyltransferase n=1 Tax=Candidatus Saccharicenans subterraneus TaxID=2508984 RepID=A0A3E2BNM6_9BACT|nr:MAG: Methylated-DNA--protein-cysteine methyltransferase [Candidatus Saccharicenans subterraneum]